LKNRREKTKQLKNSTTSKDGSKTKNQSMMKMKTNMRITSKEWDLVKWRHWI